MGSAITVNPDRVCLLNNADAKRGPVVYWMQRDQRVNDNWAFLFAQQKAIEEKVPLYIVFCLTPVFNNASFKHYSFMLAGLQEVEACLDGMNIPFALLYGAPEKEIPLFIKNISAGILVTDFNPVRNVIEWKEKIAQKAGIPFYEVDAHNIVPCRKASNKAEFGAYTIRPKIHRLLDTFLEEFPHPVKMKKGEELISNDWNGVIKKILGGGKEKPYKWIKPGEKEALKSLQNFIEVKFERFSTGRNNPAEDSTSNLSPYFHFGHLAPQRAALAAQRLTDYPEPQKSFLEELIVRRELADNFCFYNKEYDSFNGFHAWAKETLNKHRADKREYVYSKEEFEKSLTHDPLWNAAQREMVVKGKMHGYMRMYWGKKILEWTKNPEEALSIAIYLNDRYELDGRDPNGYAGIAWSIGGVHDRAWGERPVFGKIRYMNYNGCRRKFDVDLYIDKVNSLNENI